jgi:hypothetical protein
MCKNYNELSMSRSSSGLDWLTRSTSRHLGGDDSIPVSKNTTGMF